MALSLLNFAPQILTDTVEFSSKSFGFLVALLVPLNLTMPKPKTVVFTTVAFIARIVIGLVIISVLNYIIHFDQQTFIAITLSMYRQLA